MTLAGGTTQHVNEKVTISTEDMKIMDRYFDDFEVGERFRSGGATMTEADIINYALAYDPQPFHIDTEAAAKSAYGGLIASGQHTFGVGWRMFLQEGLFKACSMGSPGVDELRWTAPVRPGDTIYTEAEVLEILYAFSNLGITQTQPSGRGVGQRPAPFHF